MADYIAGRGTTALGIIGTVLGGIGTVAAAHGGNYGYAAPNGYGVPYEAQGACMHDVGNAERMAEKDAEIARLKSEKYADGIRDEAKQYGIEVYKELKGNLTAVERELNEKIDAMKERQNEKWTDQAVINANITNAITALDGQVKSTAGLVAQITKTAVPKSAICNFNSGDSCGCGSNV